MYFNHQIKKMTSLFIDMKHVSNVTYIVHTVQPEILMENNFDK